jgi:hypothetical protein
MIVGWLCADILFWGNLFNVQPRGKREVPSDLPGVINFDGAIQEIICGNAAIICDCFYYRMAPKQFYIPSDM